MKLIRNQLLGASVLFFLLGLGLGWWIHQPVQESALVYATWDGKTVHGSDILPLVQADLDQLEKNKYQIKKKATENFIREKMVHTQLEKKVQVPTAPTPPPELSNVEIENFLKARNLELKKMSKLEIDNVLGNLRLQKQLAAEKALADQQVQNSPIRWKIPLPEEPLVHLDGGRFPAFGPWRAPVQLVFVSNFNCNSCLEAEKKFQSLREKYKDQLKVSYRFLLNEPDGSMTRVMAEAAYCAHDQGQFWKFRDQMATEGNPAPTVEALLSRAGELGLESKIFEKCIQTRQNQKVLDKDLKEMTEAPSLSNLQAPSFVINGHVRRANETLEEISTVIDSCL